MSLKIFCVQQGDSSAADVHRRRSSFESLFCYDKAIPEERIETPIGISLAEKMIGNNPRCTDCQAKGAVLCATCSGSGLYVDSILESQGIIVKVRCLGKIVFLLNYQQQHLGVVQIMDIFLNGVLFCNFLVFSRIFSVALLAPFGSCLLFLQVSFWLSCLSSFLYSQMKVVFFSRMELFILTLLDCYLSSGHYGLT